AEKLGLPGFGPEGFGAGKPFTHPDHLYLRMVANLAAGDRASDALPDATAEEIRIFTESRRHLPTTLGEDADLLSRGIRQGVRGAIAGGEIGHHAQVEMVGMREGFARAESLGSESRESEFLR